MFCTPAAGSCGGRSLAVAVYMLGVIRVTLRATTAAIKGRRRTPLFRFSGIARKPRRLISSPCFITDWESYFTAVYLTAEMMGIALLYPSYEAIESAMLRALTQTAL